MYDLEFDTDSLLARQVALEAEMVGLGAKRMADKMTKAVEKGQESATPYGHQLVSGAVLATAEVLDAFLAQYEKGKAGRGRPHIAVKYLRQVGDMKVAAFITAKHVMNGISRRAPLTTVCTSVARALEDEVAFRSLAEKAPGFWKWLQENHKHSGESHKRLVFRVAAREAEELHWQGWPEKDRVHLGMKCIESLILATNLAQIEVEQANGRTKNYLNPTPATLEWIKNRKESDSIIMPIYLPTIMPPKAWTGPYGGGYYSTVMKPLKFVKTRNRNLLEEMRNRGEQMQPVYDAINALQNTAWRINLAVMDVMLEAWDAGLDLGDLPTSKDLPMPPKPGFLTDDWNSKTAPEDQLKEFKDWKAAKHEVHVKQVAASSKRVATSAMINVALKFVDEPEFYFPYTVDFRGRTYPITKFLDPQGDDRSKSLLEFANGEPIETEEQADWLAIHGANLWGNDKVGLEERVMWAHMKAEQIILCAEDPFTHTLWTEADKPWQFLAWCFEWAQFLSEGYGFVSHLPIAMDGSCNGLQHFSAMLRDPIGGKAVNLLPSEKPQDIYADVAARTVTLLQAIEPGDDYEMAQKWLAWGITRKDTKRSVMIVPYSGTLRACQQYILERIHERIDKEGQENIWGDSKELFKASIFLAKQVWTAIDATVVAARGAMNWLQGVAKVLSKEELPVHWTTPDGFVVHQAYMDFSVVEVRSFVDGAVVPNNTSTQAGQNGVKVKMHLAVEGNRMDVNAQRNGIAPNFVHSLDATAMRMTVVAASKQGVRSFAMIHDSFGTTAAQTPTLARVLREEFVGIYQKHDVLEEFRQEVGRMLTEGELEAIPESGILEIEDVLGSKFFFA